MFPEAPSKTTEHRIGYTNLDAQIPFKWSGTEEPDTASLQVIKAGAGGAPLEGAEFTLTGDKGTSVSGTTDRNGQIVWRDLPADEKFTLTETAAPEGYQIVAPMNVTASTSTHTTPPPRMTLC